MKTTSIQLVAGIVAAGIVTEKEINLICRRMNAGEKIDLSEIWDNPVKVTDTQAAKGHAWLMNLYKSPTGRERANNPYGYREEQILENFTGVEFAGTYDAGNVRHSFHVPLYNCCGNGSCFQYYVSGGKIQIVG